SLLLPCFPHLFSPPSNLRHFLLDSFSFAFSVDIYLRPSILDNTILNWLNPPQKSVTCPAI
ncbi:hypothetical protein NQZ68_006021, partial [Dissostichus eleginoides]